MFDLTDEICINLAFIIQVETFLVEEDSLIPVTEISMSNGNKIIVKGEDAKNFLNYGIHSTRLFNKINSVSS